MCEGLGACGRAPHTWVRCGTYIASAAERGAAPTCGCGGVRCGGAERSGVRRGAHLGVRVSYYKANLGEFIWIPNGWRGLASSHSYLVSAQPRSYRFRIAPNVFPELVAEMSLKQHRGILGTVVLTN